jgi:hypothetical protein
MSLGAGRLRRALIISSMTRNEEGDVAIRTIGERRDIAFLDLTRAGLVKRKGK